MSTWVSKVERIVVHVAVAITGLGICYGWRDIISTKEATKIGVIVAGVVVG